MKDREELLYDELSVLRGHRLSNDVARDATLTQLSVAIIAIFATIGKELLVINKTLSILLLISFFVTIFVVVIGFVTSEKLLGEVRNRMLEGKYEQEKFWTGINNFLNSVAATSFLAGITLFVTIIIIYMLKG